LFVFCIGKEGKLQFVQTHDVDASGCAALYRMVMVA
jgi:hypothetical protein